MRLSIAQQDLATRIDQHRGVVVVRPRHFREPQGNRDTGALGCISHPSKCRTIDGLGDAGDILARWKTRQRRFGEHNQLRATQHIGAGNRGEHLVRIVLGRPVDERQLREFCLDGIPLSKSVAADRAALQIIVRSNHLLAIAARDPASRLGFCRHPVEVARELQRKYHIFFAVGMVTRTGPHPAELLHSALRTPVAGPDHE